MITNHTLKVDNSFVYSCRYVVAWSTKYSRRVLDDAVSERLIGVVNEMGSSSISIVHIDILDNRFVSITVDVSPLYGVAHFIKQCKSRSAKVLRSEFKGLNTKLPTMWSSSSLVYSIGNELPESDIRMFLDAQKKSERPKSKEKWDRYISDIMDGSM